MFPTIFVDGKLVIYCPKCRDAYRSHEILEVPDGETTRSSCWGPGIPTTKRKCSGCGAEDGPWVSADIVGGGW